MVDLYNVDSLSMLPAVELILTSSFITDKRTLFKDSEKYAT